MGYSKGPGCLKIGCYAILNMLDILLPNFGMCQLFIVPYANGLQQDSRHSIVCRTMTQHYKAKSNDAIKGGNFVLFWAISSVIPQNRIL